MTVERSTGIPAGFPRPPRITRASTPAAATTPSTSVTQNIRPTRGPPLAGAVSTAGLVSAAAGARGSGATYRDPHARQTTGWPASASPNDADLPQLGHRALNMPAFRGA